jgi:acetoacetyl-CoA synthetase
MDQPVAEPLWRPSPARIADANATAFLARVRAQWGADCADFLALWRWSVAEPEKFWVSMWDFAGIVAETRGERVLENPTAMPGARWFPDARLNYAENLLRRRDDAPAIIARNETGQRRELSWRELYDLVSRLAQALIAAGIKQGDRVAGYLPNTPEGTAALLATAAIGAVWSSCSPDFGVGGVCDRFGQIAPRLLFVADGYFYNGKVQETLPKAREAAARIGTIERTVVVPFAGPATELDGLPGAVTLDDFLAPFAPGDIAFQRVPFNHPLYILYSSGTTGVPKCIVHGAGGSLLQHAKELALHSDVKRNDRVFYFSTLGWMMWNWLVSALACQATLVLWDGSPFHPKPDMLFDMAAEERVTLFGTSAKYIDAAKKAGVVPAKTHDLSTVRTICSTGSPLVPESFDYVYRDIKSDVCLSSISGGTDIVSCFVLGNPIGPVWRGEIQSRGLGLAVDVFDEDGNPVVGQKGELVCRAPFPSMPIQFWNDPDGTKYRAAYFERFPGVWCHGDYAELTAHGGMIIYGRSDAVLNPGGVRIGTAEIYRQVEQIDAVEEAIAVGQDWDGDVRVVLFVRLRAGHALDKALEDEIRRRIRAGASPRHVPARIVAVPDIPRTRSGKITELAVRDVIHGRTVKNVEALANPEALAHFKDRVELRD